MKHRLASEDSEGVFQGTMIIGYDFKRDASWEIDISVTPDYRYTRSSGNINTTETSFYC